MIKEAHACFEYTNTCCSDFPKCAKGMAIIGSVIASSFRNNEQRYSGLK
jgi:hypothetical protein